jgi:syntaxin 18
MDSGGQKGCECGVAPRIVRSRRADLIDLLQYKTIMSLFSFLSSIRRPYLLHTGAGIPRAGPTEDGESISTALNSSDPFARWKQLRHMDDKQRDELDFQVRVMLKRCMEQIRELEKAEESK